MARLEDDLRTARDLADRAVHAARQKEYAEAEALSRISRLFIDLARLAAETGVAR